MYLDGLNIPSENTCIVVNRISLLEFDTIIRIASTNGAKVPAVGGQIRLQRIVSRIAQQVNRTTVLGDVVRRGLDIVRAGDVVLRRDVHEAKHHRRQTRHWVILVRDAIVPSLVLVRDEVRQNSSCYPRRAICVKIRRDPGLSDFCCSEGSDGATQAVPGDNHSVVWM